MSPAPSPTSAPCGTLSPVSLLTELDSFLNHGEKYEIKGLFRALDMWSGWDREDRLACFDALAVVIFDDTGDIERAHVLPTAVVRSHWKYGAQDRWWLTYAPKLWNAEGVQDITPLIRAVVRKDLASG